MAVDAFNLRAEIKAWECAFKIENGRTPTVQDIKDNPDVGVCSQFIFVWSVFSKAF